MTETSPCLLIIDEHTESLSRLLGYLRGHPLDVLIASGASEGMRKAIESRPDVILLDSVLSGGSGFEVCRQLKTHARTATVPVVFLSAHTDTPQQLEGFAAGGVDYIGKSCSAEELMARVHAQLRVKWLIDRMEREAVGTSMQDLESEASRDRRLVARAIAALRGEEFEWQGLASFARQIGTNEKKLTQLFRERFSMTVYSYLAEFRLERAKWQLLHTSTQVQLIAYRAGYCNASDFTRAFRRQHGISPRALRANGSKGQTPTEYDGAGKDLSAARRDE